MPKEMSLENRRKLARARVKTIIQLTAKHGKVCWYCGDKFEKFSEIEVDHILPKCRGGRNKLENYAIACIRCNQAKGGSSLDNFLHWLKRPKTTVPELVERARFSEEQFSRYGEDIEKGLRKPTRRWTKTHGKKNLEFNVVGTPIEKEV